MDKVDVSPDTNSGQAIFYHVCTAWYSFTVKNAGGMLHTATSKRRRALTTGGSSDKQAQQAGQQLVHGAGVDVSSSSQWQQCQQQLTKCRGNERTADIRCRPRF